jgi:hypothetical protein
MFMQWNKIRWITIHKWGIVYWRKPLKSTGIILAIHAWKEEWSMTLLVYVNGWLTFKSPEEIYRKITEGWERNMPWKKIQQLRRKS